MHTCEMREDEQIGMVPVDLRNECRRSCLSVNQGHEYAISSKAIEGSGFDVVRGGMKRLTRA